MSWTMSGEASITIDAAPEKVYDVVSDITRMGEWSPECQGGEWSDGSDGPREGATFNGHNKRGDNEWTTPNTVLSAKRGEEFVWCVGTKEVVACTWGFQLTSDGDATKVRHFFELGDANVGFRSMVEQAPEDQRQGFIDARQKQLTEDMQQTLEGLKANAEAG